MKMNFKALLLSLIICGSIKNLAAQVSIDDSLALVALYKSTNGDRWKHNKHWLSERPVEDWYGIFVYQNRVNSLDLSNNNLRGTIPGELGNLTELWKLKLSWNHLTGNIPASFSKLHLTLLFLDSNHLSDSIPSFLGYNKLFRVIDLSSNHFSGTVPSSFINLSADNIRDHNAYDMEGYTWRVDDLGYIDVRNNNLSLSSSDIEPLIKKFGGYFEYDADARVQ